MLLFDLDGTLVDSFADIRASVTRALGSIGLDATPEILALCRRGIGLELFYERSTGGRSPIGEEFERFVHVYRTTYEGHGRAFPGVAETLAALRGRLPGTPFAVATTKRTDIARRVVEETGLAGFFDLVRGSDELPHKPDPALLRAIAAELGGALDRAALVGDTDRDVLAARAAGCTSVAVTYGGWTRAELVGVGPDHMIDRFEELLALDLEAIVRR